ncbi:MAG: YSC84-related protein [Myxococcales bacterium]
MSARITRAAAGLLAGWLLLSPAGGQADESKQEVDKEVQTTLKRFNKAVDDAPELMREAKAVLVVPDVKRVGLVGGGEWGEGALRVGGQNVAYYKMRGGSVGLQAGYEQGDFVFVFFTDDAVNKFKKDGEFAVSAEAGVTMIDKNADATASTLKDKGQIAGFAFDDKGLMGGVTMKGTKFKRVNPK